MEIYQSLVFNTIFHGWNLQYQDYFWDISSTFINDIGRVRKNGLCPNLQTNLNDSNGFICWDGFCSPRASCFDQTHHTLFGGLLKWGCIIHFNRIVHKPSSYWGTSILGSLSWMSIRQSEGGLSDTVRQGHLDSRDVHDCVYYCIHVHTYIITYAYFSRGNIMKTCGIPNCALVHGKSTI